MSAASTHHGKIDITSCCETGCTHHTNPGSQVALGLDLFSVFFSLIRISRVIWQTMDKSPRRANIRYDLLAASGFLVISLFYAWQVVFHFPDHIAGHGGDGWQNLWNMWWFEKALREGQNPYFTDLLHHPTGTTLLFHTLSPLTCLLALPFKWLFGPAAAYNIVFLIYFVASGFTMYLLVKEITQHRLAGFLAGCVFTFSHYHFAHAQSHLNLTGMQWVPLFLLFLIRSWNTGNIKDFIWLGITLALLVYTEVYYAVFAATCAFFAAVVQSIRTPKQVFTKTNLVRYGTAVLTFTVTGGILIVFMVVTYLETEFVKAHDPRYYSADLQGYFIPGWISAWSGPFHDFWRGWTGNSAECCWYLGYSVITLSVLAFVFGAQRSKTLALGKFNHSRADFGSWSGAALGRVHL